ncbi:ABC transporter transmembrane domain-containing protein [Clostridium sp. OS1-26]|nr:ABC transporter transmembrane domain-containing protein [Clostridium sp. OS1-26]WML37217.1 ABC transporter transmembrane domain-containing protein [Clostridium sp. OS1-26]
MRYAKGAMALLLINILQVSIPRITGEIIDGIQIGNINANNVGMYSSVIVIIAISIFALNYLSRLQITGASMLFQYETTNSIFKHLEKLSMSFFNKSSVGELMALSVNDVNAVRLALGRGVNLIIDTFFLMLLSIIAMGKTINMKLTIIAFCLYQF